MNSIRSWSMILLMSLLALAPMLLSTGCETAEKSAGTREDAAPREGYPAGPFGVAEGALLMNHDTLVNSDGGAYSLQQNIYADGGNKLLLISTSAGWCTACIEEQPKLQGLYDEYYDKGLTVMVSVFEDSQFMPAAAANAEEWKSKYNLTFDVVADPSFVFKEYYDEQLTPMTMLVDVNTMKILRLETGFNESTVRAIIESQL